MKCMREILEYSQRLSLTFAEKSKLKIVLVLVLSRNHITSALLRGSGAVCGFSLIKLLRELISENL